MLSPVEVHVHVYTRDVLQVHVCTCIYMYMYMHYWQAHIHVVSLIILAFSCLSSLAYRVERFALICMCDSSQPAELPR